MRLLVVFIVAAALLTDSRAEAVAQPALPAAARALLSACGAEAAAEAALPADAGVLTQEIPSVRFFFLADVQSRHVSLERFLEQVERERPELVVEGGDFVHDGTEAEFLRAAQYRAGVETPWYGVRGNHEAELRGPFSARPPPIPEVSAFTHRDVRFILLDNHNGTLSEDLFQRLEAELEAHSGRRIVVVTHVPALVSAKPAALRLRRLVPFPLASPVMTDIGQVRRLTTLLERHRVIAVLAGHTHYPDRVERGGVHYITAGAAGGLTPGLGIANEYLDIRLVGRKVSVQRVVLERPPRDPVSFVVRAFRFYADLNRFNHTAQGWNYVPSASVQIRSGLSRTRTRAGESITVSGTASFERLLGDRGRRSFFADVGVSAGDRALGAQLAAGYKVRPLGDFNRNLFMAGAATTNGGILDSSVTGGAGAQFGVGFEWRRLTGELSWNRATNQRETTVSIGHRF
jgi:predicted phosphodiesterase